MTIAGSDSGGGAGIQADLKTIASFRCYGTSVVTAVTAQNTCEIKDILHVSPRSIGLQMDAIFSDIGSDSVKIGMLGSAAVTRVVAERLRSQVALPVVLDPVLSATSGDVLTDINAIEILKNDLVPQAEVFTPNLPEASRLLGCSVTQHDQMADACRELGRLGCGAVMLKGGHLPGAYVADVLFICRTGKIIEFKRERITTSNTHGTGCTLSSAIAALLARGAAIEQAVAGAIEYLDKALVAGRGRQLGQGHGPVHHFVDYW